MFAACTLQRKSAEQTMCRIFYPRILCPVVRFLRIPSC